MEYQVVLEFDAETKHYTATVPGLPIVVDAKNKRSAIKMAREAIAIFLEDIQNERRRDLVCADVERRPRHDVARAIGRGRVQETRGTPAIRPALTGARRAPAPSRR